MVADPDLVRGIHQRYLGPSRGRWKPSPVLYFMSLQSGGQQNGRSPTQPLYAGLQQFVKEPFESENREGVPCKRDLGTSSQVQSQRMSGGRRS